MRRLTVLEARPGALIQDIGRPGYAALGVPPSGALDAPALRLGNRLLGNPEAAAGIEVLLGGLRLRADAPVTVAVTGAEVPVRGHDIGAPIYLRAGESLELGTVTRGMRCYVTVRGGIEVPVELGSRATDTLSGLGPAPLRAGDVLDIGTVADLPHGEDGVPIGPFPDALTLPVLPGPRADWFHPELGSGLWHLSATSDRIGARLEGPALRRLPERVGVELPSEPIRTGAIQVPTDGVPLVFLADHPTTGGYPVVGIVDSAALPAIAQARPGTAIQFKVRQ
ncbi:biotin-dependent carboxyltransferase family protein [Sciscionella sediminilitoris]|uniref:5-oxoprolinase subunit C family protein n=1 Tax=Sciscionella sediminilitoris TaxID=1445613 RepID=UPI0004DF2945|nr:biotin-dependent carboxyltransferase family protein [Sciscionella sp. SE31]